VANLTPTVIGSKLIGGVGDHGMRLHDLFEWDEDKAETNTHKHGVSFDQAAEVLADPDGERFHLEEYDETHGNDEDRFITTASHPANRHVVLVISWTERQTRAGRATRIISARRATRRERNRYESEISS
jgi:uncharacterized protein